MPLTTLSHPRICLGRPRSAIVSGLRRSMSTPLIKKIASEIVK
jgi:hypothetical protein